MGSLAIPAPLVRLDRFFFWGGGISTGRGYRVMISYDWQNLTLVCQFGSLTAKTDSIFVSANGAVIAIVLTAVESIKKSLHLRV